MQPRNRLLVMSLGHALNDGAANYLPGVLPAILVALDASKAQAGVLMGVLLIGQGLQPFIGWISDAVGGKAITLGGVIVSTLAGALLGIAPNDWTLIALLVIMGISNSCFHPQALAGVRELAQTRRGLSTSIFLIGGEAGRGIWPFLAGVVVATLSLPYLWLLAVPALVCLPLLIRSFPSLEPRQSKGRKIHWREHWNPLARLVVFTGLRVTVVFTIVTFLPLWWSEQGGGLVSGAALLTTLYTVGIVGNGGGGHLADRIGFRNTAVLASLASVILVPTMFLVTGPWLWIVFALMGISLFATFPISVALGQDIFPENPSMGAGIGLGFCNAIGAVAVMGLGQLADRTSVTEVLWVAAALTVPAAATAFLLPEPRDRNQGSGVGEQGSGIGGQGAEEPSMWPKGDG